MQNGENKTKQKYNKTTKTGTCRIFLIFAPDVLSFYILT